MSLINDALKRANQARAALPDGDSSAAPLRPALDTAPPVVWPYLLLPVGLMMIMGVAVWFLWQGWRASQSSHGEMAQTSVSARESIQPSTPPSEPNTAVSQEAAIGASTEQNLAPAGQSLAMEMPTNAIVVPQSNAIVVAPTDTQSTYKLKGIFYRHRNPSVVINSETLFLGDTIQNARVVAIGRDSVTLVENGVTNVLTLR